MAETICWSATRFSPPRPMSAPRSPPSTSSPSIPGRSSSVTCASTPIFSRRVLSTVRPRASSSANAGEVSSASSATRSAAARTASGRRGTSRSSTAGSGSWARSSSLKESSTRASTPPMPSMFAGLPRSRISMSTSDRLRRSSSSPRSMASSTVRPVNSSPRSGIASPLTLHRRRRRRSRLLLPVAVPLAARLTRVLRARSVRRDRGLGRHVPPLLFERGLLPRGERAVGRRRDVLEERQEPRQLAPSAHEVLLHDTEQGRGHPVDGEPRGQAPGDEDRQEREVVLHRLHHLLLLVHVLRRGGGLEHDRRDQLGRAGQDRQDVGRVRGAVAAGLTRLGPRVRA